MCGIAGWYCWGEARPSPDIVKGLLLANQSRGTDAAGYAYLDPGANKVRVNKAKGSAASFIPRVPDDEWERVAASPIGLLHARATSKGSENDNNNNHPVTGLGWVVVHNGHIRNDDSLWEYYIEEDPELTRFADVDTSALPLILSRGANYLDSLEYLSLVGGAATLAALSLKDSGKLALARLGHNDLYLVLDSDNAILYYTSAGLGVRVLPTRNLGTIRFSNMTKLSDDRVLVLSPGEPFNSEVYKVERHPFSERSVRFVATPASPQSTTPKASATKHDTDAKHALPSIKWERQVVTDYPLKPAPLPFSPKTFKWNTFENAELSRIASTLSRFESQTRQTAYGRYTFHLNNKDQIFRRVFKPIKSVKKFWRKEFGKQLDLPVRIVGGETPYDNKMTLEILLTGHRLDAGGTYQAQGRLCPWCGIHLRQSEWAAFNYRCPLCCIRSNPHA